jgi:linoleoyl-CoA desaturase
VAVMAKIISSYQLYPGLLLGKRSAARLWQVIIITQWNLSDMGSHILCGHFTSGTYVYTAWRHNESKGDWYAFRGFWAPVILKANGFIYWLKSNLSHPIEHHIFPRVPAHHYALIIAPKIGIHLC